MTATLTRIEIAAKYSDTRSEVLKRKIEQLGFSGKIAHLWLADVYSIDKHFTGKQLAMLSRVLSNPVTQTAEYVHAFSPGTFTWAIEIGFLPGVTDNVSATAKEMIEDLLKVTFSGSENIYTSQITFIHGRISKQEGETIANTLFNPVIQRATIKSDRDYLKDQGMGKEIPKVSLTYTSKADSVDLNVGDDELALIGKSGIVDADGTRRGPLALDITYMRVIRDYFLKKKRQPTDIELESIAQTWSEHCKHTIFADPIDDDKRGLYQTYIKKSTQKIRKALGKNDFCTSVFTDNAGAIEFDEDYLISDKVETHNSPSALDPFGGAITGIVGVNRDAIGFGLGAKPVLNRYGFCFAEPGDNSPLYKGPKSTQKMLEPRRIMDGVVEGVNSGGNCSGIPTPQGFLYFDQRYKGKPLVFVGTIGLIPKRVNGGKSYVKKAKPGDYVVMAGGRVGLDGIHGATFSSEAMDSGSPATAVQIGDPITQKKLSDALVKEARDMGLFSSITDNGAGGLSCSVAEMAKESGGCLVDMDVIPLKYPGLSPWQTWISESQERMTLAVPPRKWKKLADLMKRRGVEVTVIGTFTDSGRCIVKSKGRTIMDIDMDFLHDGLPPRPMTTTFTLPRHKEPATKQPSDLTSAVIRMLMRSNIAGFKFLTSQYDHEVQGGSVLKPLIGKGGVIGDATAIKPLLTSQKGIVVSQGLYPSYSYIDTYHMAACSIDTAIRNAVAAGADINHMALLDNFCWCSPQEPERLGQLKRAAQACSDYTIRFKTPLISGKDSMFNDFKGFDENGHPVKISIPPTLLISSIGVIDDINHVVSIDAKFPGDFIYILGDTFEELGGSEYFSMNGYIGNGVPQVNAKVNKKLYKSFHHCVTKGLVVSSISIGRGGLAAAFSKTLIAGMVGADINLKQVPGTCKRDDYGLFSESQGRILATVNPKKSKQFEKTIGSVPHAVIGRISNDNSVIVTGLSGKTVVKTTVNQLAKAYTSVFKDY